MRADQLYTVEDISPHVTLHDRLPDLKDQVCVVNHFFGQPQHHTWTAAEVSILTGKYAGKIYTCSLIKVTPISLDDVLAEGRLCNCAGRGGLHLPEASGCWSGEDPPFCGQCGAPCKIEVEKDVEHYEIRGAPHYEDVETWRSHCCNTEDLYQDCNLTEDYDQ